MKINTLHLENFRNHVNTNISLEHINIFLGKNNNGKTSIKAGLEYLITGQNEFTDTRGQGYIDLIKNGEKKALISSDIGGIGVIEKTLAKTNGFKLNDKKVKQADLDAAIERVTGSLNTLKTTFSSSKFIEMNSDERRNFMFNLLNIQISPYLIFNNIFSKDAEVVSMVESELPTGTLPLTIFDDLYKIFYTNRTALNKIVKPLKLEFEKLNDGTKDYSDTIASEKVILRDELIKELDTCKTSKLAIDQGKKNLTEAQDELQKVLNSIENLNNKLKVLPDNLDAEQVQNDINDISNELSSLNSELSEVKKDSASNTTKIEMIKEILSKLQGSACPLYAGITCTQNKSSAVDELNAQINDLQEALNDFTMEESRLKDEIKGVKTKKELTEKTLSNAKQVSKIKIELDKLDIKKEELNKRISPIDDKGYDIILEKLAHLDIELGELNEYLKNKDEYEKLRKELENKNKELNNVEKLITDFSPSGIKSKILEVKIKDVVDTMKSRLSTLTNGLYQLSFNFGEEFNMMITHKSGTVKVEKLSESEQFRVGIILQDIFSQISQNKILVIDRLDLLDDDNKIFFNDFIQSIKDDYETIILIATGDESTFDIKGANTFIVEDGNVFDLFA